MQLIFLLVVCFPLVSVGFYGGSACCNSLCCCPGCNDNCERPPPIDYIGICSCQTCQTRQFPFYLGRDYSLPFVAGSSMPAINNYPFFPPPVPRYPIESNYPFWNRPFGCARCGTLPYTSGCQSCGIPGALPPISPILPRPIPGIPSLPHRMPYPAVGGYRLRPPIPSSYPTPGAYPGSYPTGPNPYPGRYPLYPPSFPAPGIPPMPPSIGVLTAVPVPMGMGLGGLGGFPFPGMWPGYATPHNGSSYSTSNSTHTLVQIPAMAPTVPPDVPNNFNFPAPLVPPHHLHVAKSVTFPSSMLDEPQRTTPLPFHNHQNVRQQSPSENQPNGHLSSKEIQPNPLQEDVLYSYGMSNQHQSPVNKMQHWNPRPLNIQPKPNGQTFDPLLGVDQIMQSKKA